MLPRLAPLYRLCVFVSLLLQVVPERLWPTTVVDVIEAEWRARPLPTTITPIPGPDGRTTAYRLTGSNRNLSLSSDSVRRLQDMMADTQPFFVLTAIQQEVGNTGSILSLASELHRYLELESSGLRDELRLYYSHHRQTEIETFPFRLADNQWHKLALGFSANHVEVFIDCNKVYERTLKAFDTTLTAEEGALQLWLGQRHATSSHAYFKGAIESVKFVPSSEGILEQCPHANIGCPTCSQFHALEMTLVQLQQQLTALTEKLAATESRVLHLETCECLQSCEVNGTSYQHGQTWRPNLCATCSCSSGSVVCEEEQCPPVNCKHPVINPDQCCPVCLKKCYYKGHHYDHGEVISSRRCKRYICEDGRVHREQERPCPPLECPPEEQFQVADECCRFCRGRDFCSEGHQCHPQATCFNLDDKALCYCNMGYEGDGHVCTDVDECQERGGPRGHHCHSNSHCVNVPGTFRCQCQAGYRQIDAYMCEEHDECATGAHDCSPHATCTNTQGNFSCACKAGYHGDGRACSPVCQEPCVQGQCVQPGVCQCRQGYGGSRCERDLDECSLGIAQCHAHSVCVNLPGTFHCVCHQGFHGPSIGNQDGQLCTDVDECRGWGGGHDCPATTECQNTPGGYECVCSESPRVCRAACHHGGRWYSNGSRWSHGQDDCAVCECQGGNVFCRPRSCNCSSSSVSSLCCPECAPVCVHQTLPITYHSGQTWTYQCQQCQCMLGQVDCWPLTCPRLACPHQTRLSGDCCPSCVQQDPCQGNSSTSTPAVRSTCDFDGSTYASGAHWPWDTCTNCQCKGGHVCCSYNEVCGRAVAALESYHQTQAATQGSHRLLGTSTSEDNRTGG